MRFCELTDMVASPQGQKLLVGRQIRWDTRTREQAETSWPNGILFWTKDPWIYLCMYSVINILLQFTSSNYPFGIFKLFIIYSQRVSHVEQEYTSVLSGIFSFCILFCRSLFVLFVSTIVWSVRLQCTASKYIFGIFKLFIIYPPTTGVTYRTGTTYPSGAPEFTICF